VLYFAVFKYPLTRQEVFENSAITSSKEKFTEELDILIKNFLLKEDGDFILGMDQDKNDIASRLNGNDGAKHIMQTAYRYSKKVAAFPFVDAVLLSGSLSKNYYDKNGDIDFFIVTKPDRLWICRTLLIIRYKLLPHSKKKYWCTNYFISSDALAIPDMNVFTGTELAYLIPTVNYTIYKKILHENNWYKTRFPNKLPALDKNCISPPQSILKSLIEQITSGRFGKWLDDKLLFFTLKHWQKKYPDLAHEDFELQFRSRKNVCKRHTKGFQNKVLKTWEEKQSQYEKTFNVTLK